MKGNEKYVDLKHNRFAYRLCAILFFVGISVVIFVLWGVYAFKSWDSDVVATRFIKQNKQINLEVGGIKKIEGIGYNSEKPSPSEEIAKRLKSNKFPIIKKKETDEKNQKLRLMSDDYGVWKNGRVIGNKKEIEIEIYLERHYANPSYENSVYFKVTKGKYRDESGKWKEIQIGWFENFFTLF